MSVDSDLGSQLFCPLRLRAESPHPFMISASLSDDGDFGLERDHLKTVLTAPMRRLQQKTQVFPLDVTSSARSRLTHSLETAEYARLLTVFLIREDARFACYEKQLGLCVSTAAMLHDLGNPPFGHFGEAVIRGFLNDLCNSCGEGLTDEEKLDLRAFNGNAQGLRIVHTIQRLNLSLGQLAAMIKVPLTAPELRRSGLALEKAGVFLTEGEILARLEVVWPGRARHPLSFVMELADDLAYSLADLEDGTDKGLIESVDLFSLLEQLCEVLGLKLTDFAPNRQDLLQSCAQRKSAVLQQLRELLSNLYLQQCARKLSQCQQQWLEQGSVDVSALEAIQAVKVLKRFENSRVYADREVEGLELTGASYLRYLLTAYGSLTKLNSRDFAKLLAGEGGDPYFRRLCHRISRRHLAAYQKAVSLNPAHELYYRIRLCVDYISGMTDTYAGAEYRLLSAGS